ncbi:unnamed protein product [Schistosoma margrebowiei]|uniref:Uncharacterized protein n=1 Tax=Schistosoma margrebowiei TaxID=48269 RepID=A0AA84ZNR6_9TREM|nr:unnamed protein product [Schistosoma margrebowiei]
MNINHITKILTLICIEAIICESIKTISTKPWYMKKEHLIHKFQHKGLGTYNNKINSITVHGENITVVPLSIAALIDPELSSNDADASDKAEDVHSF